MAMKVGELYAELGLDDELTRQLARVERDFTRTARGMDADAAIGLDDGAFQATYRDANGRLRDFETSRYVAEADVDTSGVDSGAAEGERKLEEMINGWAKKGALAGLAVGALIGVALVDGVMGVVERGQVSDRMGAGLGLTEEEADRLGRVAGDVYANAWGDSFEEALSAVRGVTAYDPMADVMSDQDLAEASARALDFASIFDQEVGRSIYSAGVLVRSGLAGSTEEAFDLMTRAAQKAGPEMVDELLEVVSQGEYIEAFEQLGLSGEEALGILATAARDGTYIFDKAGDGLKEFRILATDLSERTRTAYGDLGLDAEDMTEKLLEGGPAARDAFAKILTGILSVKDPLKQNELALAFFGTQFEDLGDIDAIAALQPMAGALGEVKGAADEAGTALNDNLGTKVESILRKLAPENLLAALQEGGFEGVKGEIETAVSEISALWDAYGPAVMEALSEAKTEFLAWWNDPDGGQKLLDELEDWWEDTGGPAIGKFIGKALEAAWDEAWGGVKDRAKDIFTDPGTFLNALAPGSGWVDDLAGNILGIEMPDLPFGHAGATVPGGPSTESLWKLRGGEQVVTPTQTTPGSTGGYGIRIDKLEVNGVEPAPTARATVHELRKVSARRGRR